MEKYTGLEIAVIGLAGKFPKADNIDQYWENLKSGKDCISEFCDKDVIEEGEPKELVNNPSYVKSYAYLKNKQYFDSLFFNYRPDEAELMDPQMRVYHECCWEALEDSGYANTNTTKEKIGIFASGTANLPWGIKSMLKNREGLVDDFSVYPLIDITFLSSRISYSFNLKGPAVFLQTACSSSLVAIHEACNSLLLGECSIALAGGVTIHNFSKKGYIYKEGMILSKDGKCRPFDIKSSGTVGGEGAGVVVLKRLKDAIKDGDNIYALIKGTAINNDGSVKAGYTAPGVEGQAEVIKKAQKMARIEPSSISFIEAHGTATELGDPIEIEALNNAFDNCKLKSCILGSVKSNFGHLDSAAGVAGFIKTVLAIKHRQIPATLHFTTPNPKIDFDKGPFYVNNSLIDFKNSSRILRAGVSSFGIGGTNAHVVLEEPPKIEPSTASRHYQLIVLSAKTRNSLEMNTSRFVDFLKKKKDIELPDIAYTLQIGRQRFKYRKLVVCENKEQAIEILSEKNHIEHKAKEQQEDLQNIIFMFSGQGAQYVNMCKDLYLNEKVFKDKVDECITIAKLYSEKNFHSILFPEQGDNLDILSGINETQYTQPLLFIIEYSLAMLLMKWGIKPNYMIGHSIGEYVAACISGVFTLNDALRLVIKRGELMSQAEKGCMLSINIGENQLMNLLSKNKNVDLAVINTETSHVVSGKKNDIEEIEEQLTELGYQSKRVQTSHAFHSSMMDSILGEFEKEVSLININEPQIPYVSNITGEIIEYDQIKKTSYWSKHLRSTVQFFKGTETLLKEGNATLIEIGPGKTLLNYVTESRLLNEEHHLVNTIRHPKQAINDQKYLTEKLGNLWLNGINIAWGSYYSEEKRNRVSLPTYSFEKNPYTTNFDVNNLVQGQFENYHPTSDNGINNIHVSNWQPSISPCDATELNENKLNFLIFSDKGEFSNNLKSNLHTFGQNVIEIKPAKLFRRIDDNKFELNYLAQNELLKLWEYLEQSGVIVDNIIYCSALSSQAESIKYEDIEEKLNEGYIGLSYIAKSISRAKQSQKINLTVINNFLSNITEEDNVNALKATILGPVQIIPLEFSNIKCKIIDIPYPFNNNQELKEYIPRIVNEIFYQTDDYFIAYRYKQRWVQSFYSLKENEKTKSGVEIINKGTYIITGGFGGMGFSLANDLVHQHNANVIIVHRSDFPEKKEWDNWLLTKGTEDPISKKIQQLIKMENTGCRIDLYQVDLSVEEQVKNLLLDIKRNNSKVNGLIWAAGEIDFGGIILNREKNDLIKYISSKVHGLLLFEKYLDFKTLDFISLFSSFGNVFYRTKFGQVAYNAANQFFESVSYYIRRKTGVHTFTINWCDWLDVGMTVKTVKREKNIEDIKLINSSISHGIYPKEGVNIFQKCLQSKANVSNIYNGNILEAINLHKKEYDKTKETLTSPIEGHKDEKINSKEKMTELFSQFFGKENIGQNDNFFELGGDSLKAMTLAARINKKIGVNLSIGDIYKYPTIKELNNLVFKNPLNTKTEKIQKAPEKKYYPLSSAQKRMYFLQTLNKESTAYNEVKLYWLIGNLDKNKLGVILEQLIKRHESFRTSFIFQDGKPWQLIQDKFTFNVEYLKYDENKLNEIIKSFIKPFELNTAPLIRVGIIEKGINENLIVIDIHHIINDVISTQIFLQEFMKLYNEEKLPDVYLQYKDYSEWQNSEEQKIKSVQQKDFWLNEFSREITVLELPTDYSRSSVKTNESNRIDFKINIEETRKLKSIAESNGASLYMVILSVFNIFLAKLSNLEDIIIGTITAGREHADLENIVGMFVNTLPIRNYPRGDVSYNEFLLEVKSKMLKCFDNQSFQYEELINELKIERNTERNPLFDVVLLFQNFTESEFQIPGLTLKPYNAEYTLSKFDLLLTAGEVGNQVVLNFEYSKALFKKGTIERFITYFKQIVSTIVLDVNKKILDIEIIPDQEKLQLLHNFNNINVDYPKDETIISIFEKQASLTPNSIAIQHENKSITYAELDKRTDRLAQSLRNEGVKPDIIVALLMDRSIETVIGMLSILKAGGAYLPIDIEYPTDRIEYILNDSGAKILLTSKSFKNKVTNNIVKCFIEDSNQISGDIIKLKSINNSSDLCYVIYTSGTTGNPKGVMVEHGNVVRLFFNDKFQFNFSSKDVWTMFHSHCFDFSVWEIYGALLFGGKLVIVPEMIARNAKAYLQLLKKENVTVLNQTPSGFYNLINEELLCSEAELELKYVIFGGEALSPGKLKSWKSKYPTVKLINMFGITETTVHVTYKEIEQLDIENNISNIGVPIPTLSVYILDKYQKLVPKGIIGELCVGGAGVSRGYLGKKELTNEKFIANPYNSDERLYRSGDLARILKTDEIEYIGRMDNQIKIRGYRIELGEIESQLLNHSLIKETFVLAKEKQENKYLVAYYVADQEVEVSILKNFLLDRLPVHMIPAFYVHLNYMPLTSNGKLDSKSLPDHELKTGDTYVTPSSTTEKKLTKIWLDILQYGENTIGIHDDFFELGGHSIIAVHLINAIQQEFSINIKLRDIFEFSTIEKLSGLIEDMANEKITSLIKVEKKDYYPASPAQERLFYEQLLNKENLAYNINGVFEVNGELDLNKFQQSFQSLINRHEMLRTSFMLTDKGIMQRINERVNFELIILDKKKYNTAHDAFVDFIRPFDLSSKSLMRCALFKQNEKGNVLFIDIHHIVCDGISLNILISDFKKHYQGIKLKTLDFKYVDYAFWQNNPSYNLEKQKEFWLKKLSGELPKLDLPIIQNREGVNIYPASISNLVIEEELYQSIKKFNKEANVTEFMFLISVFYLLLSKISGNSDIIIGTDIVGRTHEAFKGIVGSFINLLPLRIKINPEYTYKEFLNEVKECILEAFDNQNFQFDQMIALLKKENKISGNLFDVHFAFANYLNNDSEMDELSFTPIEIAEHHTTQYEFKIEAIEENNKLNVSFIYSTGLYDTETMEVLKGYYYNILVAILKNDSIPIGNIELENVLDAVG